jgi:hypothetical protein
MYAGMVLNQGLIWDQLTKNYMSKISCDLPLNSFNAYL